MKNLYNISSEEKNRILMLHEQTNTALDKNKLPTSDKFNKPKLDLDFKKQPTDTKNAEIITAFDKWYKDNLSNTVLQGLINKNDAKGITDILNYDFKAKPNYIPVIKQLLVGKHPNLKFDEQPAAVTPPVVGNVIKPGIYSKEVEELQKKLNEKFKANLVVDGKWGPITSAAVIKYVPAT